MLTQEENERFTRVGPGTPAGTLLRYYWQPIAPMQQLVERRVMPVRLYAEDLMLFLDENGKIGLVGNRCAHRRVKLDCAYANEIGLRCAYHGWTYDATGQCVDQPGEPPTSTFKSKITIPAYPVQELAGLIFAYLGPKDRPVPLLPRWDRLVWDNCYRVVTYTVIPCNWLQCIENTPDTVHGTFLHGQFFLNWLRKYDVPASDPRWALASFFSKRVIKHEYGPHEYGLRRAWITEGQTEESQGWVHNTPLVFPNTHVTSGSGRHDFGWRVPIDDTHTMQVFVKTYVPGEGVEVPKQPFVPYCELPMRDAAGDFQMLDTVHGQDWMAWTMQDPIMDRTSEQLGDSDRGIIAYRQLLREQLALAEQGREPINVFHDPIKNERIDLPMPWDRTLGWALDKNGKYIRGAVTRADHLPEQIADEIENLFEKAAELHSPETAAVR